MGSLSCFIEELYNKDCVKEGIGSFTVEETQSNAKIKTLCVNSVKRFVAFNDRFYGKDTSHYVKGGDVCKVQFTKNCDGTVFVESNDEQKYILWIELKSGANEVFKKGVDQIASSYIKTKCRLLCMKTYDKEKYIELGIIVSLPEEYGTAKNEYILENKVRAINKEFSPQEKIRSRYRQSKEIIIKGKDFDMNKSHLSDKVVLKELPILYIQTNRENPAIDFRRLINDFNNGQKVIKID